MNSLFENNDKYLKRINTVVNVFCIIFAALLFVAAIVIFAISYDRIYGLIPLVCEIFVALGYLIWKVVFSFLIDVKLIRNKIYGVESLNEHLMKGEAAQSPVTVVAEDQRLAELNKLNEALKAGIITQEEFDEQKKKIL